MSGTSLWDAPDGDRERLQRRFGVTYQGGALWSSMTLAETRRPAARGIHEPRPGRGARIASMKLTSSAFVGFEDSIPSEISGGMKKRAGLARAMALDPEILFSTNRPRDFDPISSKRLDDLILEVRAPGDDRGGRHSRACRSLSAIATNSVFLDAERKTMIATGDPKVLLAESKDPTVVQFLKRGAA